MKADRVIRGRRTIGPFPQGLTKTIVAASRVYRTREQAQSFEWVKQYGGGNEIARIVTDADGNIYWSGTGVHTGLIRKVSPQGNLIWSKTLSLGTNSFGGECLLGPDGALYFAGNFNATCDFDPPNNVLRTAVGEHDAFLLKCDTAGNFQWVKTFGGLGDDSGHNLCMDASGHICVGGYFSGTADLDPGPGNTGSVSAGETDVFISKFDTNGDLMWTRTFGGDDTDGCFDLAVDDNGDVLGVGINHHEADLDPGVGVHLVPGNSKFLVKLDAAGGFVDAFRVAPYNAYGYISVRTIGDGFLYLTGCFSDSADFDPGPGTIELNTTSQYDQDAFICKLDVDLSLVWVKQLGVSALDEYGTDISIAQDGSVFVSGGFSGFGSTDLDPGPGTYLVDQSGGNSDMYMVKLDPQGDFVWGVGLGASGFDLAESIQIDLFGNVYTGGRFGDEVDFDPGPGVHSLDDFNGGFFLLKLSDELVSVEDLDEAPSRFSAWPIPCDGYFTVRVPEVPGEGVRLFAFDMQGRLVGEYPIAVTTTRVESALPNGTYLLTTSIPPVRPSFQMLVIAR
ncbi:MAG: hypothetical protein IPG69_14740 [Flavobacteriales bacterium]|nr:hypothetical protein [Flavobacteriales bacterium]